MNKKYSNDQLRATFDTRMNNKRGDCIICLDSPREFLIRPCNCILMCKKCAERFKQERSFLYGHLRCPNCRGPVENFERFHD